MGRHAMLPIRHGGIGRPTSERKPPCRPVPESGARRADAPEPKSFSPHRRKEIASRAHLASVVAEVVRRNQELSPEQIATIRTVFA